MLEKLKNVDSSRYTTGITLAAVVALAIFSNSLFVIWVCLGALYLIGFYEACRLYGVENRTIYLFAILIWLIAPHYPSPVELAVLTLVGFAAYFAYRNSFEHSLFLPFLYPTIPFLLLLELYAEHAAMGLLWLIVVVAATDIFAFFGGKSFGKRKFSPASPNKTLEGVASGLLMGSFFGAWVGGVVVGGFWQALFISLLVSLFSIFGDLYESYLKRGADVKDSGNILPGHGGVLDRVDGYLFGVVILIVALRVVS